MFEYLSKLFFKYSNSTKEPCIVTLGAGEVVVWSRCPRDFPFYVMDDDKDAGVRRKIIMTMMMMMMMMMMMTR